MLKGGTPSDEAVLEAVLEAVMEELANNSYSDSDKQDLEYAMTGSRYEVHALLFKHGCEALVR